MHWPVIQLPELHHSQVQTSRVYYHVHMYCEVQVHVAALQAPRLHTQNIPFLQDSKKKNVAKKQDISANHNPTTCFQIVVCTNVLFFAAFVSL